MKNFDVIVIGGGHNGLAASSFLSKKGKKVLIIEKNVLPLLNDGQN